MKVTFQPIYNLGHLLFLFYFIHLQICGWSQYHCLGSWYIHFQSKSCQLIFRKWLPMETQKGECLPPPNEIKFFAPVMSALTGSQSKISGLQHYSSPAELPEKPYYLYMELSRSLTLGPDSDTLLTEQHLSPGVFPLMSVRLLIQSSIFQCK